MINGTIITVEPGEVKSAIMDGNWDMVPQQPVGT